MPTTPATRPPDILSFKDLAYIQPGCDIMFQPGAWCFPKPALCRWRAPRACNPAGGHVLARRTAHGIKRSRTAERRAPRLQSAGGRSRPRARLRACTCHAVVTSCCTPGFNCLPDPSSLFGYSCQQAAAANLNYTFGSAYGQCINKIAPGGQCGERRGPGSRRGGRALHYGRGSGRRGGQARSRLRWPPACGSAGRRPLAAEQRRERRPCGQRTTPRPPPDTRLHASAQAAAAARAGSTARVTTPAPGSTFAAPTASAASRRPRTIASGAAPLTSLVPHRCRARARCCSTRRGSFPTRPARAGWTATGRGYRLSARARGRTRRGRRWFAAAAAARAWGGGVGVVQSAGGGWRREHLSDAQRGARPGPPPCGLMPACRGDRGARALRPGRDGRRTTAGARPGPRAARAARHFAQVPPPIRVGAKGRFVSTDTGEDVVIHGVK